MSKPCRLIVAHFQEDLSWLRRVKKPWRPVIYTKGRDLPNEGREASTFLWAIQEHYYQDDGWLAFAQGNPLPHCAVWNVLRPVSTFTWMGDPRYLSEEDGGPWHPGLPVREFCEQHIGEWPGAMKFAAGGQFIIPAHLLRIHPKEKYAELQQLMADGDGPWVMERLWKQLFEPGVRPHF